MSDSLFKNPFPGQALNGNTKKSTMDKLAELAELQRQEAEIRGRADLPHLYGFKWYKWARAFLESKNQVNLLTAANQSSKSSTQIRKVITWATDKNLWPSLWVQKPTQFWYLYPSYPVANAEFETKWKQFLPKGKYKDDDYYGWRLEKTAGNVTAIHFNSGVHVYFKAYAQSATNLQTGSVDALFADEETPVDLFDELMLRISASSGYFHLVFTATLGQEFWRKAMEPGAQEKEELADAFKQTVSLYDCMEYEDGSPSHWTLEKIKAVEKRCSTQAEVLKRVHGKFIMLTGLKYPSFDIKRHVKPKHQVPKNWIIYSAVDPGSGGENHPAAIVFVAVRPDYRTARVFLGWRGESVERHNFQEYEKTGNYTTAGDIVEKYISMVKEHNIITAQRWYDYGCKDFNEIATRLGYPFEKAEKLHAIGEPILNTLFKNDMLFIYDDLELMKLVRELATLKSETVKRNAVDDMIDALRYACAKIPWDWNHLTGAPVELDEKPEEPMNATQREIHERRKAFTDDDSREKARIEDEFSEWNEAYDY